MLTFFFKYQRNQLNILQYIMTFIITVHGNSDNKSSYKEMI